MEKGGGAIGYSGAMVGVIVAVIPVRMVLGTVPYGGCIIGRAPLNISGAGNGVKL